VESRYHLIEVVGTGPSGPVYRAWDRYEDRLVALKVIVEGGALDMRKFHRAALAWKRLAKHPNIVEIYERSIHEGRTCIAMEFVDGRDLRTLLAPRPELSLHYKLRLILQVCEGLSHLHRHGVIHQDIRPTSIMVLDDGRVKILESGMARQALPQDVELTRTLFLLDDYRAPEQARGRGEQRSDLFSLGKVLFELLAGHVLFDSSERATLRERLETVQPRLPGELVGVVERALRHDPAERFAGVEQMRDALKEILRRVPETGPERGRVLFALHGIRTDGLWQQALMELAQAHEWRCRSYRWHYGYFSLLKFLLPWQRAARIDWFRKTYEAEMRSRDVPLSEGQLPSIVAHSFGTYILGKTLIANKQIRFDKIILCGSILPCDFPWEVLLSRGQVNRIRNEYGTNDVWPRLVRWFVRGAGPSGRDGFTSRCGPTLLEQEEFLFSHSAYFDQGHIEEHWFPFLERRLPEREQVPSPARGGRENLPLAWYLLCGVVLGGGGWLLFAIGASAVRSVIAG
jgi:serine/threonine-protein kinase